MSFNSSAAVKNYGDLTQRINVTIPCEQLQSTIKGFSLARPESNNGAVGLINGGYFVDSDGYYTQVEHFNEFIG